MPALPPRADVAVIGAGTAGAAAAGALAERGLRVVCVDRADLDRAGAFWVNGVPSSAFAAAGLPLPAGPERRSEPIRFHLLAGRGPERVVVDGHDALEVDMRFLVERLQRRARERGAELVGGVSVTGWDGRALSTSRGPLVADLVIDASGLAGPRLIGQPRVPARHICSAAQQVRGVRDVEAARGFFAERGVPPGEILCFTGIAGGFSILNARLSGDEVSILTGSITAGGHPSGLALIEAFAAEHAWVGPVRFGGARAIPLRRPFDRLVQGRVAVLGDAACQVFPAHGSGIGAGLVAARVLADAIAGADGASRGRASGEDAPALTAYAVAWQRQHGGLLAAYDLFRRFSQTLGPDEIAACFRAGLVDPETARAGMEQSLPSLRAGLVARKLAAGARAPRLAARLSGVIARMVAVRGLYALYPRDARKLPGWSRRVARAFGEPPDVAR